MIDIRRRSPAAAADVGAVKVTPRSSLVLALVDVSTLDPRTDAVRVGLLPVSTPRMRPNTVTPTFPADR